MQKDEIGPNRWQTDARQIKIAKRPSYRPLASPIRTFGISHSAIAFATMPLYLASLEPPVSFFYSNQNDH